MRSFPHKEGCFEWDQGRPNDTPGETTISERRRQISKRYRKVKKKGFNNEFSDGGKIPSTHVTGRVPHQSPIKQAKELGHAIIIWKGFQNKDGEPNNRGRVVLQVIRDKSTASLSVARAKRERK